MRFIKNHVGSLIAWILIVVISIFMLPNVNQLTREHSTISLPANVQSEVASTIGNHWGHHQNNTYQVVAVFNNKNGAMSKADQKNVNKTIRYLKRHKSELGIKSMLTPYENSATKKNLISKDKTTELVQMNVSKKETVSNINKKLTKAVKTNGIRTYITGADILQDDFSGAIQEGIKKTEVISVIFIFIVLILVFRSPIVPLISLLTVGVSFITAFSIVTNLVKDFNFPFSNFTQVFMVIVLFGIGTDYNILLYDRFKANLGNGMDKFEAAKNAQWNAGKTILMSGSSILIGFSALGLARFSVYKSASGVAIGVAVLLIVLLTLNMFFMTTMGKTMFWPVKTFNGETESPFWRFLSKHSLAHPIIALVLVLAALSPFYFTYQNKLNYDDTAEISDSTPSKQGFLVVQKHFSKGTAEPATLYIKSNHTLDNEKDLKLIDQLTEQIKHTKGVKTVASVTQPSGSKIKKLYVTSQMKTVNNGVSTARNGISKLSAGSQQMTNGLNSAATGTNQLNSGINSAATGANQLTSGLAQLSSGGNQMTNGLNQLSAGSQQLVNGMNQMSQQLSSQLTGANASQLQQLESGLPQINEGIQKLNSALQSQGTSIDTTGIQNNLQNVASQAQIIGDQLTQAGNTLKSIQGSSSSSSSSASLSSVMTQFKAAESQANLNDQQKAVMEGAMQQILSGIQSQIASQTNSQTSALSSQLQSVAQNLQTAGNADKSLAGSLQNVAGSASSLQNLSTQVATLKAQVAQLAQASNVALPGAVSALQQLTSGLNQIQSALGQGTSALGQLNTGINKLAAASPQLSNGINSAYSGSQQLSSGMGQLSSGSLQLNTGINKLAQSSPQITNGLNQLNSGLASGQSYLTGLQKSAAAETFYIPKSVLHSKTFKPAIDNYLSSNRKITKITIVFDTNPSDEKATNDAENISNMARKSLKGTALSNATVAMGGQSSRINDIKKTASSDFVRTAAIMLIGIGIALMLITHSLLQPVYILGSLLLAYISSLSINHWLVGIFMHRSMLAWNTPFFSFIMLIALGVDYSIFLMTRYREIDENKYLPGERIYYACAIIGTVVISAAIILSGTFAALIPSGIPTLIEVAMTVIVGLIILVIILPIVMTSTIYLSYPIRNHVKDNQNKRKD
ncbi:MMPL family transporter [Limosilactobacillus mucosae]|uniref:MMPL family transporter n=1 Tax=Limosilactobacillus mucosae TaxID=97478 RepID=A0AAJ1MAP4_LIMMU|nr:MMPL family transporter [Limosilactobacillus mucosae]MDC2830216.1 MMPL family transporter [Limosilactobacillus mucosae]MDC2837788.1 MMPL family transporter [Limosilactobacillus mucosae]MDC2849804.1 MMPL family transporter [Limosilactobacillus mucosae]MDC2853940.1 MMPL family transporter [Limosilactobacillus mucosae]